MTLIKKVELILFATLTVELIGNKFVKGSASGNYSRNVKLENELLCSVCFLYWT
jgi:hypothetical protein